MVIFLDKSLKNEIIRAINAAEKMTSGEIRVHIQSKSKEDVFFEAKKVFHRLKMHKTKERNGVLIFIALKSKRFAILGDSGIHEKVGNNFWNEVSERMAEQFKKDQIKEGIIQSITCVGEKLKNHFPRKSDDKNELSNEISQR